MTGSHNARGRLIEVIGAVRRRWRMKVLLRGMLITLAFIPGLGWSGAIAGFVLFRVFDVIKPYPAARFEQLHGGLGVMADDAMAAVYANVCLRALMWLAPDWIA